MTWKQIAIPSAAIPIIAFLGYGLTRDPNVIESPLPGRVAFDFTAPTLGGDTVRISDFRGKVVLLNFWASWCLPCLDEHPALVEAEQRYRDSGFQLLGVIYQDSPENAARWLEQMGGSWPSLVDLNSRIAIDYGLYGVPETFFIGRDGRIAYKHIGPLSRQVVKSWVERLLEAPVDRQVADPDAAAEVPVGRSEGHVRAFPGDSRAFPEKEKTGQP